MFATSTASTLSFRTLVPPPPPRPPPPSPSPASCCWSPVTSSSSYTSTTTTTTTIAPETFSCHGSRIDNRMQHTTIFSIPISAPSIPESDDIIADRLIQKKKQRKEYEQQCKNNDEEGEGN